MAASRVRQHTRARAEQIAGTADYPPRGSPDAEQRPTLDADYLEPLSAPLENEEGKDVARPISAT